MVPDWKTQYWYPKLLDMSKDTPLKMKPQKHLLTLLSQTRGGSSTVAPPGVDWLACGRQALIRQGVTGPAMEIVINSWRKGTRKQYQTYVKKWLLYSKQNKCNIFGQILQDILAFFVYMHTSGSSYSAICTARSALSSFINISSQRLGSHPLVTRFITGIYNAKPSTPRYTSIWDTDIVLRYLVSLGQNIDLSLKMLTLKLCMLLSLITAQRGQMLQYLDLDNMQKSTRGYVFVITKLLKQSSRSGRLCSFSDENKLCIV